MAEDPITEALKFDPGNVRNNEVDEALKFDPSPPKEQKTTPASKEIPQEDDDLTWKEALVQGFQNIPSSGLSYGKDMAVGLAHLVSGVGQMVTSPIQTTKKLANLDYGKISDALIGQFKGRYGSVDAFKQTLAKDPVAVLGDLSTLVSGVGGITKAATLGKVGGTVATVGSAMEPLNVARGIAALPLRLLPERIPIEMYQSAVKFGTTLSAKERLAVTKTAISAKNQIMPTSKGMEKLRGMIDAYNDRISTLINNSTQAGAEIPVTKLYWGLDNLKNQFKRLSDEPAAWDTAFKQIETQWSEAMKVGAMRTPEEVQKIKTRIYKDLETFYEKQKATPAKVELRKAIARNARQSLEDIIPEIKQLNKNEGELIDLWDAVESKANRITNRDLIGIGLPVKMGTGSGIGYMFGGAEGAAIGTSAGFALGVFDTPQVKAKVALVLNRLREKGITVRPTTAALKLGLFQAGREE